MEVSNSTLYPAKDVSLSHDSLAFTKSYVWLVCHGLVGFFTTRDKKNQLGTRHPNDFVNAKESCKTAQNLL